MKYLTAEEMIRLDAKAKEIYHDALVSPEYEQILESMLTHSQLKSTDPEAQERYQFLTSRIRAYLLFGEK